MDSVAVLIAAPGSGAITPEVLSVLRDLGAGAPHWLAEGEAAEFHDFQRLPELLAELKGKPIDAASVSIHNRRKRILIADMDSTMIEQECIDELGVMAGVGDRIREITTRAMRAYLHATPRGADLLTGRIAGALDAAGIPFRMKILRRPAAFLRCDAAVLYARTEDAPQVVETLRRLYPDLRGALRAPTPPMTLRLAPGLAWAEDPGDLDSFGHHRCGILAEGLVRAAELGERGVRARVRRMERAMAEAGLDPARPYLEPGSSWAPVPFP